MGGGVVMSEVSWEVPVITNQDKCEKPDTYLPADQKWHEKGEKSCRSTSYRSTVHTCFVHKEFNFILIPSKKLINNNNYWPIQMKTNTEEPPGKV